MIPQHRCDESNDPLYPFGHGLSYTTFEYSDLQVEVTGPRSIDVTVTVSNSGSRAGTEVVRPVKELKGFARVALAPGESSVQRFRLTEAELGYFLPDGSFVFEPGDFLISVGPSSVLSQQVTVSGPQ